MCIVDRFEGRTFSSPRVRSVRKGGSCESLPWQRQRRIWLFIGQMLSPLGFEDMGTDWWQMKKDVDDVWWRQWRLIVCGCVCNLTSASRQHVMTTV